MSDRFILPLRSKIAAGFATAVLVLAVGAISYWTTDRAQKSAAMVDHTGRVLLELQRLLGGLADAETSTRGYTLTGDTANLDALNTARIRVPATLRHLRQLTADNPLQQTRLDTLESVAQEHIHLSDQIAEYRRDKGFIQARDLMASTEGKIVMDHVRSLAGEMEAEENHLLSVRSANQKRNQRLANLVILIGTALAFTLSMLINRSIYRDVVEREKQRDVIEKQTRELKRQAGRLEAQQKALENQLEEQQALAEELSASNDSLSAANIVSERLAREMSALLESTAAGFYGMGSSGECTFINGAGARMLGYTAEELLGADMHELVHNKHADGSPYPLEECPIYQASQRGDSATREDEVFWRKDGTPLSVEYSTSPIGSAAGKRGAVVAFADISDRKRTEAERKRAAVEREQLIKALARSNTELDQFAYVASHDLKAPLRGIANLSQWIEEDLGEKLGGENKSQMGMLRGRVHRMEALIDGILQYSRAGRVKAKAENIDTAALVAEVVELMAPPKEMSIRVAPGMPEVNTEKIPLQQVFMNLIGNAIKHAGKTDPLIEVSWADAGPFFEFSVADNGQGIAPQYHERIFGIFQMLEARDKVEGTGIGLSVVQKIVDAKGGRVWVESQLGQGARFKFLWPKIEILGV
jgi:PAS domain S-box-containing protein